MALKQIKILMICKPNIIPNLNFEKAARYASVNIQMSAA